MEIYREQPEDIAFKVPPGTTTATATISRDGLLIGDPQVFEAEGEGALTTVTVAVPYKAIRYDGKVVIEISSQSDEEYINRYTLDVVTPVLSLEDVAEIIGANTTPQKARETERAVRVIIEAYTGQRFGLDKSVKTIVGQGEGRLQLPQRLIAYTGIGVSGVQLSPIRFSIGSEGWLLNAVAPDWLEIKEAPPEELLDTNPMGGPIRVPAWYRSSFIDGQSYVIDGLWGWESTPMDVEEAARLLVNDYACNQAAYRDRYLEIIKSSDWTMQFSPRAWEGTGNARADFILSQYKRPFVLIV